jgi:hypothetical protein
MGNIEVLKDPKQDIKFWLDALSNTNIDRESKELLNQCLQAELKNYLYPIHKIKIDPMPIDDEFYSGSTSVLMFE